MPVTERPLRRKMFQAEGGLIVNDNVVGRTEGEATTLTNFEVGIYGGYRRITGFAKYSDTEVSGTGKVLGVAVYSAGVIAARLNTVYYGTGTTWATVATRTAGSKYQFDKYNWDGTENILIADQVNPGAMYDGTTYTLLNDTNFGTKPTQVWEHNKHIFMDADNRHSIIFSAPYAETDSDPGNGAGEIVLGDTFVKALSWRDQLIIFCKNSILRLQGESEANWALHTITDNIGCLAAGSVQEAGGDVLFLAPDGIRTISGTDKIDDFEIGALSRNIHPRTDAIFASTALSGGISSLVVREKSQYRLFYPEAAVSESLCKGIIGGVRGKRDGSSAWEWGDLKGIKPYVCDSAYIGDDELVVHGGYDDGFIYQQESGDSFAGSVVPAEYITPDYAFDDQGLRKILHKVTVYLRLEGGVSVSLNIYYDYNSSTVAQPAAWTLTNTAFAMVYGSSFVYGTSIYGTDYEPLSAQAVEGSGFTAALGFSTSDTEAPYSIEGFLIEYALVERR